MFKKSQKQVAGDTPADSAQSLSTWATQLHNRALAAKKEGRLDEALELLGQLVARLRDAAHARSPQLLSILARADGLRAITLDQVGGRPLEVVSAVDLALDALETLGTGTAAVAQQIPPMLVLRISAAESSSLGEPEVIRLLEDSVERIRRLPADPRRAAAWILWDKKLITMHADQGRLDEAARVARRVIERLPALGAARGPDLGGTANRLRLAARPKHPQTTKYEDAPGARPDSALSRSADLDPNLAQPLGAGPDLDFVVVHAGRDLAVAAAPKLADVGARDLAAELAERCAELVGDASATSFSQAQSLTIAKGFYVTGMKFLGLTGTSLKLLSVAVAQFRAAGAFESQDAQVQVMVAGSLNAYAWELACRNGIGDNEAALPMAREAVERARSLTSAEEASSHPDMPVRATLAASLDTLATIQAQLGETAIALETAREAQSVARRVPGTELTDNVDALGRVTKLVDLIEQGAIGGFTDRP